MLNQDASAKAMVQAAEVEVNRLKPLVDRNIISDVMLETAKAKLARQKRLWKHCRKHRLRNYIFPVNGDWELPSEGSLVNPNVEMP
jgi:membrane fusion protein (multidrug efflux system)